MKNKNTSSAFTLIELLVTIVIMGVLSTVAVSTFQDHFGKANDAVKRQAGTEMEKIVIASQISRGEVDYSDLNNDGNPDDKEDIINFFKSQGYSIPKLSNDRCIIYGYLDGTMANYYDSEGNEITKRGQEFFIISQSNEYKKVHDGLSGFNLVYKNYVNGTLITKLGLSNRYYQSNGEFYASPGITGEAAFNTKYILDCSNSYSPNFFERSSVSGIRYNFKKFNISD